MANSILDNREKKLPPMEQNNFKFSDSTSFEIWDGTMAALRKELNKILDVVPAESKILYVDYPVYHNIGDQLIMLGTESFFQENSITPLARYSAHNFPWNITIRENVKIVCQGGGNFGDIWDFHQNFRNKLVSMFPCNPIVILPQSIYFGENVNARGVRKIFENHSDIYIFVREQASEEQILKWLPGIRYQLCPDMSHMLWPGLFRGDNLGKKRLNLFRNDKEKFVSLKSANDALDWPDIITKEDEEFAKKIWAKHGDAEKTHREWLEHVVEVTNRAIKTFSGANKIATDRLHGHLLSCLMGIPNIFLPNAYHKNESYYETWTKPLSQTVKFVSGASRLSET